VARTVRDAKLETRSARAKLKPSGTPHYRGLDPGLHLGYRKGKSGGRWVVRWRTADDTYKVETIGTADDTADADGNAVLSFAQAQAAAREWRAALARAAKGLVAGGDPYTVRRCLDEYVEFLDAERKTAVDAGRRIKALILPALGNVVCADLTKKQIETWRDKLAKTPPRLRTRKGARQRYADFDPDDGDQRRRRRAATNRTLTVLKAALNRAWRDEKIESDAAWRRVTPFEAVDAARVRYLTVDECRRLINGSEGAFRDLVRAALATGARYGELAALKCCDFDPDAGTLLIRTSKAGKPRHVVLRDEGAALFARLAAGCPGDAPMLRRPDSECWGKSSQHRPMVEACGRAGILPMVNFHCLRHTFASLAIMAGAPLLVVARNLGHRDTRMVEKHYGHLAPSYIADEIRRAAPRFGFVDEPGEVVPIASAR
jgi:integrase